MRLPFLSRADNPLDAEAYELLDAEETGLEPGETYIPRRSARWRPQKARSWIRFAVLSLLGILVAGLLVFVLSEILSDLKRPYGVPYGLVNVTSGQPLSNSLRDIQALYSRQSRSLVEASARYALKTNRPPPRNYDKWFHYARHKSCLIDDYDQIYRDFEPFYQLVQKQPDFFRKRVELEMEKLNSVPNGNELKSAELREGSFSYLDDHGTLYNGEWPKTMERIGHLIPDTKFILNGRDEPRVLFNIQDPPTMDQLDKALKITDDSPFTHRPRPTYDLYKVAKKCLLPNKPTGFTGDANNASAFLIESSSIDFSTDFYPVLSMTKIIPCFSDILVPSEFYNSYSGWAPHYKHSSDIAWEDKKPKLYWRGASSGGWINDQNDYHDFPRFKLVDIGRNHTDLIDVGITVFQDSLCGQGCNSDAIHKEYGITGQGAPREEQYGYKYLMDVDGNSFSGRYFGLLRSGSLVFKSTVFSEYFNDWIRPFEHYIPVLPDLSDLVERLEWAVKNDAEAKRIQEAGKEFADRVMTDAQNDCYFALVLLEWANLMNYAG